jgi:hypothetical protein
MKGEAFVKMPRDLLESDAWRSLGVNARRFVDFLMREHMRHGGRDNGRLLAPRRQLERAGIGARHVSRAIEETASLGLVVVKLGGGRRPNHYALSWLPMFDGTQLERPWSMGRARAAASQGRPLQMTSLRTPQMLPKGSPKARSDARREVATGRSDFPSDTARGEAPS